MLAALAAIDPALLTTVAVRLEEPLRRPGRSSRGPRPRESATWAVLDDALEEPVLVGWAVGAAAARLPDRRRGRRDARRSAPSPRGLGVPVAGADLGAVARWGDDPFARGAARSSRPASTPTCGAALGGAVAPRLLLAGEASQHGVAGDRARRAGERQSARRSDA